MTAEFQIHLEPSSSGLPRQSRHSSTGSEPQAYSYMEMLWREGLKERRLAEGLGGMKSELLGQPTSIRAAVVGLDVAAPHVVSVGICRQKLYDPCKL